MRLILRTQKLQAKLEGQQAITDRPDDFQVIVDGPSIGRIYLEDGGPSDGKWRWCLQVPPYASGMADTLDAAKAEIARLYQREITK